MSYNVSIPNVILIFIHIEYQVIVFMPVSGCEEMLVGRVNAVPGKSLSGFGSPGRP